MWFSSEAGGEMAVERGDVRRRPGIRAAPQNRLAAGTGLAEAGTAEAETGAAEDEAGPAAEEAGADGFDHVGTRRGGGLRTDLPRQVRAISARPDRGPAGWAGRRWSRARVRRRHWAGGAAAERPRDR